LKKIGAEYYFMKLTSPEFENGEEMPEKHGYMGENVNPELHIENVPAEAKSLALAFKDPDAQDAAGKTWLHWLTWSISTDTEVIEEDSSPGIEGETDFRETEYNGPNPPDGEHVLVFKLYALREELELGKGEGLESFDNTVEDKIIEEAELKARYPHEHVTRDQ
jgi:Raf kinase inhibitor-like YbhB/YbcL family protein